MDFVSSRFKKFNWSFVLQQHGCAVDVPVFGFKKELGEITKCFKSHAFQAEQL